MEAFILDTLNIFWAILKNWWWLPLPFIIYEKFLKFWRWYRTEQFDMTVKRIVLEIKVPKDIIRPIKAMEQVFSGIHGYHDVFGWRDEWIKGEYLPSLSFDIVCTDGEVHFYIRCPEKAKQLIESNIYAQYPDAEISVVPDYTKMVPQNLPNKDWDVFGLDMVATKDYAYPIKTYVNFEGGTEPIEEKRIDPLAGVLDGMATLGPGEHLWLQMMATPIREEIPWQEEGKKIVADLVQREDPKKFRFKPMTQEAMNVLLTGKPPEGAPEEKKDEGFLPPEMKLTPGEREIVKLIEEKIGKFGYKVYTRFLYLGKRDVFFKPKARIPYGFYKTISTENMNGLKPDMKTIPKIQWFFKKRREYMRKRAMFRRYVRRFSTLFPRDLDYGVHVFTVDEMATLFHFPGRAVAPAISIPRIETKKKEPPPDLPFE